MNNQKICTIATPTKVCFKCEQEKPLSEFPLRSDSPDGYRNDCKVCGAEYNRAWNKANRERKTETDRAWRKANPDKRAEIVARSRAKYPERWAARKAVNHAVERGEFPAANTMVCDYCQEALAEHWHHHLGYEPEHALDVVPMCIPCHFKMPEYLPDPGEGGEEGD